MNSAEMNAEDREGFEIPAIAPAAEQAQAPAPAAPEVAKQPEPAPAPAPESAPASVLPDPEVENEEAEETADKMFADHLPVPKDLAAALKLLHAANALPTRTRADQKAKAIAVAHAQRHFARLQNVPSLPASAHAEMGAQHVRQVASMRRERMDILARQNPEVADFLAEFDAMKKASAEVEKLRAERDELRAQLEHIVNGG